MEGRVDRYPIFGSYTDETPVTIRSEQVWGWFAFFAVKLSAAEMFFEPFEFSTGPNAFGIVQLVPCVSVRNLYIFRSLGLRIRSQQGLCLGSGFEKCSKATGFL